MVAKVRVYELAKEFGVESKAVMDQLKEMGEFVRSASSTIDAPLVRRLKEAFAAQAPGQDQRSARFRLARDATAQLPPKVGGNDLGSEEAFLAAIDETIKYFNDSGIVEGTVVKVDRDEVLLDIGYKTEGVIPSRELSIKHDVDPREVVKVGEHIEALVLQTEDKEGRLVLSKKRAQSERARGAIENTKEDEGVVSHGRRDATPRRPSASTSEAPEPESMRELFESWDALRKLVPDDQDSVAFLANRTSLKPAAIYQVRKTRNQCAHPGDGWPGPYDVDIAVATARELLRRLEIPRKTRRRNPDPEVLGPLVSDIAEPLHPVR